MQRGRAFDARDARAAPKVAIVDAAFARRHFPGEEPIGHALDIGNGTDGEYQIVGVVGDVHQGALDAAPEPTMYVPFAQDEFSSVWMVVRTSGDPAVMTDVARRALRAIDPGLPAFSMAPLASIVSESVAQRRFAMLLLGLFAVGVAGALALSRFVRTMLFGVTPFDPASYGATAAVLLLVAAAACYVPARRAMGVDPLVALRQE